MRNNILATTVMKPWGGAGLSEGLEGMEEESF